MVTQGRIGAVRSAARQMLWPSFLSRHCFSPVPLTTAASLCDSTITSATHTRRLLTAVLPGRVVPLRPTKETSFIARIGARGQHSSSRSEWTSGSSSASSADRSVWAVLTSFAGLGLLCSALHSFHILEPLEATCKSSKGRLTLAETKEVIQHRLDRYSPVMAKSLLKWECREKDGRTYVKFNVLPNADHFCLLLSSLFEVGRPSNDENASSDKLKKIDASLHAWDNEEMSTGVHLHFKPADGGTGGGIVITLPWKDTDLPSVELFSAEGGFLEAEAVAVARMIRMGNLKRVFDDVLTPPGLHDFLFGGLPAAQTPFGTAGPDSGGGGEKGKVPESREGIVEKLEELGAQVYGGEGEGGKAEGLSWDYLAGVDDIKQQLKASTVFFQVEETVMLSLTHPEEFRRVVKGTRGDAFADSNKPRAVLFEGPPGCGKTSMGRMMAGRAGLPMVYLPLEAVSSKWYGEGEKRLSQVFSLVEGLARQRGALLFLDEVEALAVSRDSEIHEASRRMLSVLLRSIDGFQSADGVTVVAATNRVADIDAALRSRFDLLIPFPLPDKPARAAILEKFTVHLSSAERDQLAGELAGLSGRNIREVCEQAERRWAGKVIRGIAGKGSLPPASEYAQLGKERLRSGLQ